MDGTIIGVGNFTQTAGNPNVNIQIPSGSDVLKVINWTQIAAGANISYFQWNYNLLNQSAVDPTTGLSIAINGAMALGAANSFIVYNPNLQNFESVGAARAITNINAGTGLVLTANTTGLQVGSVVRLSNLAAAAAQELAGIDFRVTAINAGVSFTIGLPTPTAAIGATAGFYRIIGSPLFVPQTRLLFNVTQAAQAVVTTNVQHGFSVGQLVRFNVPTVSATEYGMTELNGLSGTILTVPSVTTFTVNVDTSAMGAFAFPAAANVPFTYANVVPYGDNTAIALAQTPPLSSLEDATYNSGYIGMQLLGGANNPAGVNGDFITWEAYKATYGGS